MDHLSGKEGEGVIRVQSKLSDAFAIPPLLQSCFFLNLAFTSICLCLNIAFAFVRGKNPSIEAWLISINSNSLSWDSPSIKLCNVWLLLFQMKNSARRINNDKRIWWVSAQTSSFLYTALCSTLTRIYIPPLTHEFLRISKVYVAFVTMLCF